MTPAPVPTLQSDPPPADPVSQALIQYLHRSIIGDLAVTFRWDPTQGSYDDAVVDTCLAMGWMLMPYAPSAYDMRAMRAVAQREIWRMAMAKAASLHDFTGTPDRSQNYNLPIPGVGGMFNRAQIYDHCKSNYDTAVKLAAPYVVRDTGTQSGDEPAVPDSNQVLGASSNYGYDPYKLYPWSAPIDEWGRGA